MSAQWLASLWPSQAACRAALPSARFQRRTPAASCYKPCHHHLQQRRLAGEAGMQGALGDARGRHRLQTGCAVALAQNRSVAASACRSPTTLSRRHMAAASPWTARSANIASSRFGCRAARKISPGATSRRTIPPCDRIAAGKRLRYYFTSSAPGSGCFTDVCRHGCRSACDSTAMAIAAGLAS